jgi:hypothetical protein
MEAVAKDIIIETHEEPDEERQQTEAINATFENHKGRY